MTNEDLTLDELLHIPDTKPPALTEEEITEADAKATIITLFDAAIDPTSGILVPNLVVGWLPPGVQKAELEDLVGPEIAEALTVFAKDYSRPPHRSLMALQKGRCDKT